MSAEVLEIDNVKLFDLLRVGDHKVRNMVAVTSDDGICILDRLTGEMVDSLVGDLVVQEMLFEHGGSVAIITGYGRNRDSGGMIPGESSITTEDKLYKVVFAVEGFCVATIHDSPGLPAEHGPAMDSPQGAKLVDSCVPFPLHENALTLSTFSVAGYLDGQGGLTGISGTIQVVKATNVRIYDVEKIGSRKCRDTVSVNAVEGCMLVDHRTGHARSQSGSIVIDEVLFKRDGQIAILLGCGMTRDGGGLRPGSSSIITDEIIYKVVFALEGFSVATIHHSSGGDSNAT